MNTDEFISGFIDVINDKTVNHSTSITHIYFLVIFTKKKKQQKNPHLFPMISLPETIPTVECTCPAEPDRLIFDTAAKARLKDTNLVGWNFFKAERNL